MGILYRKPGDWPRIKAKIASALSIILVIVFAGILYQAGQPVLVQNETDGELIAPPETLSVKTIYKGSITRNSNLYAELLNLDLPGALIANLTDRFSHLFNLTNSHPGDSFQLFVGRDDSVLAFEYVTKDWKKYRLDREGSDFIETIDSLGYERSIQISSGIIKSNLWEAMSPLLPDQSLISDMVDIFGWEVDFLTESKAGDGFKLIYEVFVKDGQFIKTGNILAAEYIADKITHRAFLYIDSAGHKDYYDEKGYSLRKALLKSPLNYRRISSRFSFRRLHPIYKVYRPHLGVDYAAPFGTPVVSAGDGTVTYKGWKSGFGNYVEVKHSFGLITGYGHLRGFSKDIKRGEKILQGQVLGYVGMTGDATGPHLDYRMEKNGRFVDPLRMILPAALPVNEIYRAEFNQIVSEYLQYLDYPYQEGMVAQTN